AASALGRCRRGLAAGLLQRGALCPSALDQPRLSQRRHSALFLPLPRLCGGCAARGGAPLVESLQLPGRAAAGESPGRGLLPAALALALAARHRTDLLERGAAYVDLGA